MFYYAAPQAKTLNVKLNLVGPFLNNQVNE